MQTKGNLLVMVEELRLMGEVSRVLITILLQML